jgi:hypothetical protein
MSSFSNGVAAAISVSVLLAACKGEPRPTEELSRAKTLVEHADAANVQRYAAVDLNEAHDKLRAAEKAAADDENGTARRRANEASADAELASARADSRAAEEAAKDREKSLEMLRQEAARGIAITPPRDARPND